MNKVKGITVGTYLTKTFKNVPINIIPITIKEINYE